MTPNAGRRVVVAGTGPLGQAIAAQFVRAGARVMLAGPDVAPPGVEGQLVADQTDLADLAFLVDLTDAPDVERVMHAAAASLGGLDVFVHAAGAAGPERPAVETDVDEFDAFIRASVRSVFLGSRYVAPLMGDDAAIVHVAPPAGTGALAEAAEAAVTTLTRGLAWELAPRIRVNLVCPRASAADGACDGDEVAAAVLFLAGPEASFLTGVRLPAPGGLPNY